MAAPVRILVVGLGNMGASHASAYHRNPGFEIVGLCSRTIKSKPIPAELQGYPLFEDYAAALAELKPDAVSINTWPNTHADYAVAAMEAGAHVFMEKPIATNFRDVLRLETAAAARNVVDEVDGENGENNLIVDLDSEAADSNVMGDATPIDALEGILGSGDSGGSAWIETTSGWAIAATNTWGDDAVYGSISGFSRVSTQLDWIGSIFPGYRTAE